MPWNVTIRCPDGKEFAHDYTKEKDARSVFSLARQELAGKRCRVAIHKWSTSGKVTRELVMLSGTRR